jgi:hypothetical protein
MVVVVQYILTLKYALGLVLQPDGFLKLPILSQHFRGQATLLGSIDR